MEPETVPPPVRAGGSWRRLPSPPRALTIPPQVGHATKWTRDSGSERPPLMPRPYTVLSPAHTRDPKAPPKGWVRGAECVRTQETPSTGQLRMRSKDCADARGSGGSSTPLLICPFTHCSFIPGCSLAVPGLPPWLTAQKRKGTSLVESSCRDHRID